MVTAHPLLKRIKRHVIGREHTFFAATLPGLESLCKNEIASLSDDIKQMNMVHGGIEFKGRLTSCYAANLQLRIPNRILMRIAAFKATNFRRFEKKIMQIPWELYLFPTSRLIFSVSTQHSRLYHKTAIAQRLEACIHNRTFDAKTADYTCPHPQDVQHLFVRSIDDHFFVSLNTSGDFLYKRGLKTDVGQAPLRETLAASILAYAGYDGSQFLMDPMCGSGTFSLEAAMLAKNIPPGWYRDFAFMTWPAFRESQWRYIKKNLGKSIKKSKAPCILASDIDPKRCSRMKKISRQFDLSDVIRIEHADFFNLKPDDVAAQKGILVLNPPHGIRMRSEQSQDDRYDEIIRKLKKDYKGWRVALLIKTNHVRNRFPKHFNKYPLFHGGIDLTLLIGAFN